IVPGAVMLGIQQHWQAPLPPPDAVERYEKILPGAFDRMVAMTEQGQAATIRQVDEANRYRFREMRRGQYFGTSVAVLAIAGAVSMAVLGHATVAALLLGPPMLSISYALVSSWTKPTNISKNPTP